MKDNLIRGMRRLAIAALTGLVLLTAGCGKKSEFSAPEKLREYLVESLWFDTIPYKWDTRRHVDSIQFKTSDDTKEFYKSLNQYIWDLHLDSRDNEALFLLHQVAHIIQTDKTPTLADRKQLLRTYVRLGATFADLGMPGMAVDYYQLGLDMSQDTVYNKERAMLYNNLGILYAESEMFENAVTSFEASLEINNRKKDRKELVLNYMNLAKLEWMRDSLQSAMENAEKGIQLLDSANEQEKWVAYRLLEASIQTRMGNYPQAYKWLNQCRDFYETENNPIGVVDVYTNLAEYYLRKGQNDSALHYSNLAIDIAKLGHRTDAMFVAGDFKAKAYRAMGKSDKASDTYRRMEKRRDSLQKAEYRARIDARNQSDITTLKYSTPQSHTLEWILGAGNVVLLALLIWSLSRNRRK